MVDRILIDEYGEGNCCPKCNSIKILKHVTCELAKSYNLRTNKEHYYSYLYKKLKKMSNRDKAMEYDLAKKSFYILECEKCSWKSDVFKYE